MARNTAQLDVQFKQLFKTVQKVVEDPKERVKIYDVLLKRGSLPIAQEMRRNVDKSTYSAIRLSKSIKAYTPSRRVKVKMGYTPDSPLAVVSPKVVRGGASIKKYPFYWHWYEYGTKGRRIKKKKTVVFKTKDGRFVTIPENRPGRGRVKKVKYGKDTYSTVQPHLNRMLPSLEKALLQRLDKELTKRGLTRTP